MSHHHYHHHIQDVQSKNILVLWICIVINLLFVAIEAIIGWRSNSTGLLSDAGHNLSDVLGLILSLVAIYMARSASQSSHRVSLWITLANSLLLMFAVVIISVESVRKIFSPAEVDASAVVFVAAMGIVVNGVTVWLLMRDKGEDINIRAAYLHAASDALVSIGVVASGGLIYLTGINVIDPIVSIIITLVVAVPTIRLIASVLKKMNKH